MDLDATKAVPSPPPKATFCQIAKPLLWSKEDTVDTIEQIKEHNKIGVSLCGWGK